MSSNVIQMFKSNPHNIVSKQCGSIRVEYSFDSGQIVIASIALRNRLYVSGWELSYTFQRIIKFSGITGTATCIVYNNNIPIAITVICKYTGNISSFTRKAERNKGFGKLAIQTLLQAIEPDWLDMPVVGHNMGSIGCDKFFKKCGLDVEYNPRSKHYAK